MSWSNLHLSLLHPLEPSLLQTSWLLVVVWVLDWKRGEGCSLFVAHWIMKWKRLTQLLSTLLYLVRSDVPLPGSIKATMGF